MTQVTDNAAEIERLERLLAECEKTVAQLQGELRAIQQRSWASEACGDDAWDL